MVCPLKAHKYINYDNQLQKPENQNLDLVPTTTHYFKESGIAKVEINFEKCENRSKVAHMWL